MTIYTKGDLIEEFSRYCEDIASSLDELAEKYGKNNLDGIVVDVLGKEIPNLSIWWDETNKANFIDQMNDLYINNKDYFDQMVKDGGLQLGDNPKHIAAYGAVQKITENQKSERFYYERLLPHPVGVGDMKYGHELRETKGYQTLNFMCEAVGCSPQINLMVNPKIDDLVSAFRLCLDISTEDGTPILPKIQIAKARGMFSSMSSGVN